MYSNNFIKLCIVSVFIILGINTHAQKFIFEISPGLKFIGSSFQKNTAILTNGTINEYGFNKIQNSYSYENFQNRNQYGLEPIMNVAFFELNKKWNLNLDFTSYLVLSKLNAFTIGYPSSPDAKPNTLYTEYISKKMVNNHQQIVLNATREFKPDNKWGRFFESKISLGFGINRPSIFNTKNEIEFYESYMDNSFGYEKIVVYQKSKIWGEFSPVLNLKYEVQFRSTKHDNGLFNLFLNYVQGFSNHYDFRITSNSAGGSSMDVKATNRGSGLRLGISKTFKFIKAK